MFLSHVRVEFFLTYTTGSQILACTCTLIMLLPYLAHWGYCGAQRKRTSLPLCSASSCGVCGASEPCTIWMSNCPLLLAPYKNMLFIIPQLRNTAVDDTCKHYRSTSRQQKTEIAARDGLEIIRHTVRIWHRWVSPPSQQSKPATWTKKY